MTNALGCNVVVVEKRGNYFRNILFDLGPQNWYFSHEILKKFGWEFQILPTTVTV